VVADIGTGIQVIPEDVGRNFGFGNLHDLFLGLRIWGLSEQVR